MRTVALILLGVSAGLAAQVPKTYNVMGTTAIPASYFGLTINDPQALTSPTWPSPSVLNAGFTLRIMDTFFSLPVGDSWNKINRGSLQIASSAPGTGASGTCAPVMNNTGHCSTAPVVTATLSGGGWLYAIPTAGSCSQLPTVDVSGCSGSGQSVVLSYVQPSPLAYDWSSLDHDVAQAVAAGSTNIVYNMSNTPDWATATPTDGTCSESPGACNPPYDLVIGSPSTSASWSNFVTALATRYCGQIKTYELWNEANHTSFWSGTQQQLAAMAQIAYPILHNTGLCASAASVVVLSPNIQSLGGLGSNTAIYGIPWLRGYMSAGGAGYADAVSFHGYNYCGNSLDHCDTDGASYLGIYSQFRNLVYSSSFTAQPKPAIYDTEVSFLGGLQANSSYTGKVAYLGAKLLTSWPAGISQVDWYAWDSACCGQMWSASGITGVTAFAGLSGCAAGDVLNVVQGGASQGQVQITQVSVGVPTAIAPSNMGTGYTTASGLSVTAQAPSNCVVSGATVNITATANTTNSVAAAYKILQGWMVGSSESCSLSANTMWVCTLTNGGVTSYAVWAQNGSPIYTVPAGIGHKFDLFGASSVVTPGQLVSTTLSPVLFAQ